MTKKVVLFSLCFVQTISAPLFGDDDQAVADMDWALSSCKRGVKIADRKFGEAVKMLPKEWYLLAGVVTANIAFLHLNNKQTTGTSDQQLLPEQPFASELAVAACSTCYFAHRTHSRNAKISDRLFCLGSSLICLGGQPCLPANAVAPICCTGVLCWLSGLQAEMDSN